ncbi:carbohydrate porin [Sphingomonas sp. CBMAI 2297]|uniref:carbohydrate porin n=1 Tax=Sphingomonas sp. CBMAI 2297 TaxID=2991720 RepID=UPI0024539D91|nr:carbohydrate porin [Sphingomonas sp. CBMAI 2297]MDH4743410.1 carbohydrate porin [Sphingomonas sp. CBMAI 2297]
MGRTTLGGGSTALALLFSTSALAQEAGDPALDIGATYRVDLSGVSADGRRMRSFGLDDLNIEADGDLARLVGWKSARFHIGLLNNFGGRPNDVAGTLQGVDNIEVASPKLRLFEVWVEQKLGTATTVRAGLYDLNSEFYASEASGLLLAPAFGVGSEIAATGPNGPSIFPTTALAIRVEQRFGGVGFARVAVLNATAGALGDDRGSALDFQHGALLIGEAGVEKDGDKLALGAWGYTRRQDDIADTDDAGNPVRRKARGAYVIAEKALGGRDAPFAASLFARAGISDGRTTPYKGGWQAGLRVAHVVPGRDDSQFSIGMNQAYLADRYRDLLRAGGVRTATAENAIELTYSDQLASFLTLQPDLQFIWNRGGDEDAPRVTVITLRTTLEF